MLEVKNLKKEYRTKKGAVTRALDDVSLTFPETGMVFILGKSGSGKSTLLNVCGGLDRMDSGEIIIKGKSSKDFSAQDFDSYRNTYVGFVFQEYNILDEFTVEQNIALALELQNKKPDKAVIDKILSDVDLTDFATRKPNTLSGGQKQRVAIARALVKEPQIIMADEPTGALDSKTGQQVFDALKGLSKEKLILVISHDRDFAEQYGDRIIELKDGKVISDQVRAEGQDGNDTIGGGAGAGLRFFGTDTVCVTDGAKITDADLASIKSFLEKSGGAAVISTSREKIAQFKEERPEINMGTFDNIKEQPVSKQYEPQKLIRSHLPVKHAIKMGASGLKTKPVRLAFTILLSIIAFIMFGLASTLMLFDGKEVRVKTFTDSDINYISLAKQYYYTETFDGNTYEYDRYTRFTEKEYEEYKKSYNGAIPLIQHTTSVSNLSMSGSTQTFYGSGIRGIIPASAKVEVLAGRMPQADDEVAITDFVFDAVTAKGSKFVYGDKNTQLNATEYADIIYSVAKPITARVENEEFKIVGVFKGMNVPSAYKDMKHAADNGETNDGNGFSSYTWSVELECGIYMTVAVTDSVFKSIGSNDHGQIDYDYFYFKDSLNSATLVLGEHDFDYYDSWDREIGRFAKYEGDNTLKIYGLDGGVKTSLGNGEAAISSGNLMSALYRTFGNLHTYIYSGNEYTDLLYETEMEAETEFRNTHRVPQEDDDEFYVLTSKQQENYDEAMAQYESNRSDYIQGLLDDGVEQGSEEYDEWLSIYDNGNKPKKCDYGAVLVGAYDKAYNAYYAALLEYVEAAVNAVRISEDLKYREVIARLEAEAEAKYREENPEPSLDDGEAHDEWQLALSDAVTNANPYYLLSDLLTDEYNHPDEEIIYGIKLALQTLDEIGVTTSFTIKNNVTNPQNVNVVAYYIEDAYYSCYLGDDLYETFYIARNDIYETTENTKYKEPKDAYIHNILIQYDGSRTAIEALLNKSGVRQSDDSAVKIRNSVMEELDMIIDIADGMEMGFTISGAVLALFAFLLMFNFISASITAKKKDIGILRAIGARTLDVFKIFISEAFIIALICFAVSAIGTFGLCMLLNSVILEDVGLSITLLVFGPLSVLCIFGVAFITAIVSTVIPVGIYSRKPPIASIRAL